MRELDETVGHIPDLKDGCKFCLGAKGGVKGNENNIGGVTICDYCTSLLMTVSKAERDNPTSSIFRELSMHNEIDKAVAYMNHMSGDVITKAHKLSSQNSGAYNIPLGKINQTVPNVEQVQWRNITKTVEALAKFNFGGPDYPGMIPMGTAYIALVNSLTAKDGLDIRLEPLTVKP